MPASAPSGACRRRRSPTSWPSSATASDGYPGLPGWGAKGAAAVLARYGHFEDIPDKASAWEVPGVGGARAVGLAAIAARALGRGAPLPRPRPPADRRPTASRSASTIPTSCAGTGAPRDAWEAFCEEWGLDRLRTRPHRWLDEDRLAAARGRLPDEFEQRRRDGRRAPRGCRSTAGCAQVEPRAAVHRGHPGAAALGDQPGGRDVPGGQPALLDERIEPAVGRRRRAPGRPSPSSGRCG